MVEAEEEEDADGDASRQPEFNVGRPPELEREMRRKNFFYGEFLFCFFSASNEKVKQKFKKIFVLVGRKKYFFSHARFPAAHWSTTLMTHTRKETHQRLLKKKSRPAIYLLPLFK